MAIKNITKNMTKEEILKKELVKAYTLMNGGDSPKETLGIVKELNEETYNFIPSAMDSFAKQSTISALEKLKKNIIVKTKKDREAMNFLSALCKVEELINSQILALK